MAAAKRETDRRQFLKTAVCAAAGTWVLAGGTTPVAAAATNPGDLAFASAMDAARAIRRGDVSSVELTRHMLERIDKYNPKLNAIVVDIREEALRRAEAADADLARNQSWGRFHGVPITIKESYGMEGLPTTSGAPFLKDYRPTEDAVVVQRMRDAGAVILGKSNVPLMTMDIQSYNEVYGTTNNPWDLERTPGGSTGGGAAAVAAGLSFLSVGGDIGGSIRTPSHFCGVYGHKPSLGVLSEEGHIPPIPGSPPAALSNLSVAGPLARTASDLMAAVDVLGGPSGDQAAAYKWFLPPARGTRVKDYRIGYMLDDDFCPVLPEVKEQLQSAVDALRKAGAQVEEGWPEGLNPREQLEAYLFLLVAELTDLPAPNPADVVDLSPIKVGQIFMAASQASHREFLAKDSQRVVARQMWQDYFKTHDAFLMPVAFVPAFPHQHEGDFLTRTLDTSSGERAYADLLYWISFATLTGLPATVAPVGLTRDTKLPVGIQVMGPFLEDATPIDIAGKVGELTGGYQPPPGYGA